MDSALPSISVLRELISHYVRVSVLFTEAYTLRGVLRYPRKSFRLMANTRLEPK